MNDLRELEKIWDALSSKYNSHPKELLDFPYPSLALPQKGDMILDIGCGAGSHMAMFSSISDRVYGIDISPKMIKYANKYGYALIGDIRKLPFPQDTFDYVFSRVAINYISDWPKAISEMSRVIKPEGLCIIAGVNKYSFVSPLRYFLIIFRMYKHGETYHTSVNSIIKEGEKCGLSVLKTDVEISEPNSDTKIRNIIYSMLSALDRILNKILPWWGGFAVVMFSKTPH